MRKLIVVAILAAVAVALVPLVFRDHEETVWPASEDPVCAAAMASRAPDLVLTDDSLDAPGEGVLIAGIRWPELSHGQGRYIQVAGFLHFERVNAQRLFDREGKLHLGRARFSHAELYSMRGRAFIVEGADRDELDGALFLGGLASGWGPRHEPPDIDGRCAVVVGQFARGNTAFMEVARLLVWLEPHRPLPPPPQERTFREDPARRFSWPETLEGLR